MKLFSFFSNRELSKLLAHSKQYLKYQKLIFIFSPMLLGIGAASPFIIRYLFDNIIQKYDFSKLPLFVLLFIIIKGFERFLSVIVNYNFRKCGNLIIRDEQIYFIKKVFNLPVKKNFEK
ncbi:hypothetical protein JYK00_09410 [Thermosipho ferrireducens]|uniref:ABC transmembrane type-1 domain-containing protein n=1 Tax=Thermosipho ferrireducens TaxID=2571116 RepID=A0ABX7S6U8_9BACT|nr:hypothetical protein [Thermosipho ferrireducens]QTA37919.1 hypothetical protein JYK00_09410 [Thermosipho ferrireducens]